MQLIQTCQIDEPELCFKRFDLAIAASGFEKRATNCFERVPNESLDRKVVLGFDDRINAQRTDNDRFFDLRGFSAYRVSGNDGATVGKIILEEIEACEGENCRILIDYSSMTRSWYAGIIDILRSVKSKKRIDCFFAYSPARFQAPVSVGPNQYAGPLTGFAGFDSTDRPTALVIGLGYDRDRALGLMQYVDPAACFALIADPPLEREYLDCLHQSNSSFLKLIPPDRQIRHPLADLQRTSHVLLSLVWGLSDDFRVILAPLGVKPLSLMCLLLALRYPELDVWRVSAGESGGMLSRSALGPLLTLQATFEYSAEVDV